jgi:peptide/nickel transport system permease protein
VKLFIVRRALLALAILFVASILVFTATQLLPGNAALAILGKSATPQRIQQLDAQLHLNGSPVTQYLRWLSGVLTGHLGTSLASGAPVSSAIGGRLVNTAFLVASAAVVGIPLGLAVGIVSAAWRDRWPDNLLSSVIVFFAAVPEFILGLVLVIIFGTVVWQVLPATANLPPGTAPWDDLTDIILPALTLALAIVPYVARIMRAAMVDALASEYVEFAQLRGLSRRRVVLRHALPNAFGPVAQATAISLAYLAGGAIVVEYIFAYPGIGQGLVYAVQARDVPTIQIDTVILAAFYVMLNLLADIVTIILTPRVRTGSI